MINKIFYSLLFIVGSTAYAQNDINSNGKDYFVSESSCQNDLQNNLLAPSGALDNIIDNLGKHFDPNNPTQGITVDSVLLSEMSAGLALYTAGIDGFDVDSIGDLINNILFKFVY